MSRKRGSRRPSLFYQFYHSINKCFKENYDKRSLKLQYLKGKMTPQEERAYLAKVWSYRYKTNLLKFVKSFISWMKDKGIYSEYKYAYELDSEVFVLYLADLVEKGNSYQTIKTYMSYIRKLEAIMSYTLPNYEFDYTSLLDEFKKEYLKNKDKSKLRVYSLSKENHIKLMDFILKKNGYKPMKYDLAVLLIAAFGFRAREVLSAQFRDFVTLEDIKESGDFKKVFYLSPYNRYVKIAKGKNGQVRYVPVVFQWQLMIWNYIKELQKELKISEKYYIVSLSDKKAPDRSLRYVTKELLKAIGVDVSAPTSTHMVRKAWSKMIFEYFDRHLEGMIKEHIKYFQK